MPFACTGLSVLFTGPSDTQELVHAGIAEVHKWNSARAAASGFVLLPRHYSTDAVSLFETGADGQAMINDQLVNDADIVISLFRHKLGSPTPRAPSGTAEEIALTMTNGRRLHIYFSTEVPDLRELPAREQWDGLTEFKGTLDGGLWASFDSSPELRDLIGRALEYDVVKHFAESPQTHAVDASRRTDPRAESALSLQFEPSGMLVAAFEDYDEVLESYVATATKDGMDELAAATATPGVIELGSLPTESEWRSQLDEWATSVRKGWRDAVGYLAGWAFMPAILKVEQQSDRFLKSVRIDLILEGVRGAAPEPGQKFDITKVAQARPKLPGPVAAPLFPSPAMLHTYLQPMDIPDFTPIGYPVEWSNIGDDMIFTVELEQLRPRTAWSSEPQDVVLFLPRRPEHATVHARWTATAEGLDGKAEGSFVLPVHSELIRDTIRLLVPEEQ